MEMLGECWVWPRSRNSGGYGTCRDGFAHRVAYEAFRGPIPTGHDIHHRCGNRACVNPFHLETKTRRDHLLSTPGNIASVAASKTHCPQGHPYDEVNTYVTVDEKGSSHRSCKRCNYERNRAKGDAIRRFEWNKTKTHCVHGHPFDEENTYVSYDKKGKMHRACKTCAAIREKTRVRRPK